MVGDFERGGGFENLLPSAILDRGQGGDDHATTLFAASAFADMFRYLPGGSQAFNVNDTVAPRRCAM